VSLSDLNRLFNNPLFSNQVKIKPTDKGFKVKAAIQGQIKTISTHWPHNGSLDPAFLHELYNDIIKKFMNYAI
jgi:hypothetical protein